MKLAARISSNTQPSEIMKLVSAGFKFFEMNVNMSDSIAKKVYLHNTSFLRILSKIHEVAFTFHINQAHPADYSPRSRLAFQNNITKSLNYAEKIKASIVNFHPFQRHHAPPPEVKTQLVFLKSVGKFIKQGLPRLSVENLSASELGPQNVYYRDPFFLRKMAMAANSKLFTTFDIGHYGWCYLFLQHSPSPETICAISPFDHIHIHDVKNGQDHQPVGSGSLNWEKILKNIKKSDFDGILVIENNGFENLVKSKLFIEKTLIALA